jgi:hypothetical protein
MPTFSSLPPRPVVTGKSTSMQNIGISKRAGSSTATSGKPATNHSVGQLGPAPREVPRMIGPTRLAECQKVADLRGARIYLYPDGSAFNTPQDLAR